MNISVLALIAGMAFSITGCGAPAVVVGASYAADGGLLAASNKTSTDHLVSMVSKKDCAMWRVLRNRPICSERPDGQDPYAVDYAAPHRMMAEDGVQYGPPLRPAGDAPAASWDAAAFAAPPAAPLSARSTSSPTAAAGETAATASGASPGRVAPGS